MTFFYYYPVDSDISMLKSFFLYYQKRQAAHPGFLAVIAA